MDPDARFFLIDLAMLSFFLPAALLVGRVWTLFASALQFLSTLSHPAAHFLPGINPWVYITVFQVYSYGVYLAVAGGALASLVKRRAIKPLPVTAMGAADKVNRSLPEPAPLV